MEKIINMVIPTISYVYFIAGIFLLYVSSCSRKKAIKAFKPKNPINLNKEIKKFRKKVKEEERPNLNHVGSFTKDMQPEFYRHDENRLVAFQSSLLLIIMSIVMIVLPILGLSN